MAKYLRWFLTTVRPYRTGMIVLLLCHILLAFCGVAFVYVSKVLVDMAVAMFSGPGWGGGVTAFPFRDPSAGNLIVWACAMVIVVLLRIILNSLRSWLQTTTEISMKNGLRKRLFNILLHRQTLVADRRHTGDTVSRLQEDVRMVSSAFAVSVPGFLGTVFQFLAAFTFFVILDARLAILVVIVLPAGLFSGKYIAMKIRNLSRDVRESDSKVQSHLQESIQHLTVLQSLEYAPSSLGELDGLQNTLYASELRRTKFSMISRVFISLAFAAGQAIAFLWGVVGISRGTVTYGMMTAFLQLFAQVQRPLVEMSSQLPAIVHCTASIDRLMELESSASDMDEDPVFMNGVAGVRFTGVSFAYPDSSRDILHDFSHDFTPGSRTAVVGPTGIGKSTLIRLMLSFLKPLSGKVEIYDADSAYPASPSTRCNLVFVPQGNSLFSGTVRDNLLMGNPDADDEMLVAALHTAAADFVLELREGLDTQCFEAGAGLSEGQAQRIAIARALLRPGSILLLDEFSSALDADTENIMMQRLTEGLSDHTMIFITHREAILRYCDSVLRLERRGTANE